ncbi:hypothetical protein LCL97_01645 [Seohaeicola saemankumensis]|nr:hypothetical protein [Seohaeicola saemankumensis]MCA0869517.1 hypothetical protein [Seohaeicola saemankumensis]
MKKLVTAALLAAGLTATMTSGPAAAQTLSRILSNTGLSPEDFSLMGEAGRQLYDVASPRVGGEQSWSNPESGSYGVARLAAMQQGCASLVHMVHPKGVTQGREIRTRLCKSAEGKWVLQP